MKKVILLLSVTWSMTAYAQNVGINTTGAAANTSAMLDIDATNKGLLIPRVALTGTASNAPIGASVTTSLMVYNTATVSDVTPGFYYWNGSSWVRFLNAGTAWLTAGNTGTISGTHYVGTTDAQALDFRTANTIRFRVANANQVHAVLDGTAALPFYSFTNNTNMGMYRAAANTLAFAANGAERLRVTSTEVVVNENANAVNFRVENATNANLLVTDNASTTIGFNRFPVAQSVGGLTIVNDMAYPFEIGNDGVGALQATIGWYNGSDVLIMPETNAWGFVGNATRAWWRMNSYGYITVSSREKKKEITPIIGNPSIEDYVMNSIDNMQTYFYRYQMEDDVLNESNYTKYRPMLHIGTILEETPDYLKDAAFSGVDNYAIATLALSGVKINHNEIKELKKEAQTISDFGSVSVSGSTVSVQFNSDFSAKLGNQLPVVTITSNNPEVTMSIVSKSSNGFSVQVNGTPDANTYFDWIAMGHKQESTDPVVPIDESLKRKLEVDEATKLKLIELYQQTPTTEPTGRK